ncbi:YgaP-like transmembrane domain, partial [Neisseria sp. P0015.S009]|uniref:YgaP-like transmembrane domain n=1 Tax=Neisseria sp. P0015.S009 TaxID=3436765 RepID=UPI003F80159E
DIIRQVLSIAGSLILLGVLAGWLLSPWFYLIDVLVGAGLLTAGLTGFCGMARLLA